MLWEVPETSFRVIHLRPSFSLVSAVIGQASRQSSGIYTLACLSLRMSLFLTKMRMPRIESYPGEEA